MAVLEVRDHVAGLQFQGSEQRGRAVAFVVVGAALELPGP